MKKLLILLISILVLPTAKAQSLVREVKSGELYRSSQLTAYDMEGTVSMYGIKTVINLRGAQPNERWWNEEKQVLERHGVNFINIPMSAKRIPTRENLLALLDAYKDAPRPILIHCQAGVDRTGEAVALYQMIHWNTPKKEARRSILPSLQKAKYYFVDDVFQGMDWAYESYFPCNANYKYFDKGSCPQ